MRASENFLRWARSDKKIFSPSARKRRASWQNGFVSSRLSEIQKVFSLNEPVHAHAIEALADETRAPLERVGGLYVVELERLMPGARIKDYLPVLISRRVRQILREQADVTPA